MSASTAGERRRAGVDVKREIGAGQPLQPQMPVDQRRQPVRCARDAVFIFAERWSSASLEAEPQVGRPGDDHAERTTQFVRDE